MQRVTPPEWALLDCIAATRAEGILHGELGRWTKQNKHSVPARTNRLQAGGYIVKQAFMLGNTKTSRCVLRRYVDGQNGVFPFLQAPEARQEPDEAEAALSTEEMEDQRSSPAPASTPIIEPHSEQTDEASEKEQLESDDGNMSLTAPSPSPKRRPVRQSRRAMEIDQVDSDDSDVPSITSASTPKRRTQRKSQAKKVQPHGSDEDREAKGPRGRPRRFLRGTEKFWQWQFWQAKLNAVEGDEPPTQRSGTMHDPAGLALFNARPADFDQTLVDARSVNFPVPGMPKEITEAWVEQTRSVLESQQPGAYATPSGVRVGKFLVRSKVLVVRSNRLEQIDFSNDKKAPRYRFITSSLSHSQAFLPSQGPKGRRARKAKQEVVDAEHKSMNVLFLTTSAAHTLRYYPPILETTRPEISGRVEVEEENDPLSWSAGPRKGVFHEVNVRPTTLEKSSQVAEEPLPLTAVEYRELMDSTESDSDIPLPRERSRSAMLSGVESRTFASVASGDQYKMEEGDRDSEQQPGASPSRNMAMSTATATRSFPGNANMTTGDGTNSLGSDLVEPDRNIAHSSTSMHSKKRTLSSVDTDNCSESSPNPAKRLKTPTTNALERSRIIRQLILDLLAAAGGAGPADPGVVSAAIAARWQTMEGGELPGRDVIKRTIQNMWDGGNLRKIYFSVVALHGTFHQRPIMALDSTDPEGVVIRGLKDKIKAADKGDYVPPEWRATPIVSTSTPVRPKASQSIEKRKRRRVVSLSVSPEELSRFRSMSREQDKNTLAREERNESYVSSMNDESGASPRPKRKGRPSQLRKEPTRSPDLLNAAPTAGRRGRARKPTVKATSYPDIQALEDSSSDSELEELGHEGFLTLKVARLGTLPHLQHIGNEFESPATITARSVGHALADEGASPASSTALPARRVRERNYVPRKNKDRRFEPKTLRPVWEKIDGYLHATCLQDILEAQASYDLKLRPRPHGNPMERAFDKVDIVWAWEERVEEDIDNIDHEGLMINHVAVVDPDLSAPLGTWSLVVFSEDGNMSEVEQSTFESWPRFLRALEEAARPVPVPIELMKPAPAPRQRKPRKERPPPKKRKAEETAVDDSFVDDRVPLETKRPKRNVVGRRRSRSSATSTDDFNAEFSASKRSKNKPAQHPRKPTRPTLSDDEAYDISLAVTVIRTLAGGIEKLISWPLVQPLFPDMPLEQLQRHWQTIYDVHYAKIQTTTCHLQELYLPALEKDEVPTINFDNLTTTEWPTIIAWAKSVLTATLPPKDPDTSKLDFATRTSLLSTHTLTYRQPAPLHDVLTTKTTASIWRREQVASTHIFGTPLLSSPVPHSPSPSPLSIARSAILSTILTPAPHFSPHMAAAKLTALTPDPTASEYLVRSALDSLIRDKLIMRRTKTVVEGGVRSYCVSDNFTSLFGRGVNAEMLRVANAYKIDVLDWTFRKGEVVRLAKERIMEDGEMLCLLGLMGRGLVKVRVGGELPGGRYGVEWERVGYKTEKIGRLGVGFEVVVEKMDGYVYGVGGREGVEAEVPLGGNGRAPVWMAVDGDVMREEWEMILASVVGTISLRPGSSAKEISEGLGNAIGEWEAEVVLTWAQRNGFLRKTSSGGGYDTEDWWWTCVGRRGLTYDHDGFLAGKQKQTLSEPDTRANQPMVASPPKSFLQASDNVEVCLPGTKDVQVTGRMTSLADWSLISKEADTAPMVRTRTGRRTKATLIADDDAGAMIHDDDDVYEDD